MITRENTGGLEYLRMVASGEIGLAPMVHLLGIKLTEVVEGSITLTAELRPEFENGLAIAHGGFVATLLDTALGCAVNTVMPAGRIFTTLEMKINYTRAITAHSGTLTCIGTVVHAGRRTATAEGRVTDANGKLVAHGSATCIVFHGVNTETQSSER